MDDLVDELTERLAASQELRDLLRREESSVRGLPVSAAAWVFAQLNRSVAGGLLVVVPRETEALYWLETSRLLAPDLEALPFPAPALTPYQETESSLLVRAQEAVAVDRVLSTEQPIVVCTPRALFRPLPSAEAFSERRRIVSVGDDVDSETLALELLDEGYRRTDLVVEVGSFAVRGGVFDVFPPGVAQPVRIDLFGDTVDTLRLFDPVDQRSRGAVDELRILPLSLFPVGADRRELLAERLEDELGGGLSDDTRVRVESLARGGEFAGWENYLPLLEDQLVGITEILGDHRIVCHQPELLWEETGRHRELLNDECDHRLADGGLAIEPNKLLVSAVDVERTLAGAHYRVNESAPRSAPIDFGASETESMVGQLPRFTREVELAKDRGETLILVAPGDHHERLGQMLGERGIETGRDLQLLDGDLRRGFRLPVARCVLFGESQLYPTRSTRRASTTKIAPFLSSLRDLKVGEFVVHQDHGIGRFVGMRILEQESSRDDLPPELKELGQQRSGAAEVMEIEYASGRTLLLPLQRVDQIQRFAGLEGIEPKLDRLGGTSWNKKKDRIKRGLRKLAVDLLKLYAEREVARAPAVGPDSDSQRQFETDFEFDETPDQLKAVSDIFGDLERERPMDRLLCGDVGFGKTEVAMRAAFKMVDNGWQVAVLAPTTILADQHLQTFQRRFADFPVTIEMVSRFRTGAELKDVRARLESGGIDILIGTHRLLGKDIVFKRLGLLVIDEEQRFGVGQKEKLKELRRGVHVLSMSATPVPRTLQMALAGVRDLSTIESPPKDRMAVETQILPFSGELVREAIEFELEREGQVYFVHNRVEDIEQVATQLRELVPEIRLVVGHGQLDERELSLRMRAFKEGRYDLLLATTIIENGIDIPNVNTMLIHHAERFGLAQLYQLRGRVGRSSQLAFCYLLVPPDRILSIEARKRLQAIQEFGDLGAGFRIAARDLEIRGAGNLLGAEQSGHINELGIETYMKMLEDTVRELRGESLEDAPSAAIDLPISMTIPQEYIADANLRMEVYRRLALGEEARSEILDELRDRFGAPPRSVELLAEAAELKGLAETPARAVDLCTWKVARDQAA